MTHPFYDQDDDRDEVFPEHFDLFGWSIVAVLFFLCVTTALFVSYLIARSL